MPEESLKSKCVALIRRGRALEREAIAALTPEQREATGTLEKWATKDKLVHINATKAEIAEDFAAARAGREHNPRDDFLVTNNVTFEIYRDTSWDDVERFSDEATDALIAEIEAFSEEELAQPGLYDWLGQRNAAEYAVSSCIWHGLMHMSEAFIERGEGDAALEMLDGVIPATLDVMKGERARGTALYNQACIYAQVGRQEEALNLLDEAFRARPDLKEFSTEDGDLSALWDTAEFRQLVA